MEICGRKGADLLYSVLVQTYAHTSNLGTHNVYVLFPKSMLELQNTIIFSDILAYILTCARFLSGGIILGLIPPQS